MKERYVPPKLRLLQVPHGVTSQKTPFFVVTAVKTSNLTWHNFAFYFSTQFSYLYNYKREGQRFKFWTECDLLFVSITSPDKYLL
jgi:hypothetical protein